MFSGLKVSMNYDALTAAGRVQVEQRISRLLEDAQPVAPTQRLRLRGDAEAKEMHRIGLLWEQSIAKAAASHQREDEARRIIVEVVAEERQHMRVAARAQHAHLALQIIEL